MEDDMKNDLAVERVDIARATAPNRLSDETHAHTNQFKHEKWKCYGTYNTIVMEK